MGINALHLSTRNSSIDLAKFVAAILVIGIHTSPFKEISASMNFYFCNLLCRLAVPFFAICTGYYLTKRLVFIEDRLCNSKNNLSTLKKNLQKIARMYLSWSLFYLMFLIYSWLDVGSHGIYPYFIGWCKSLFISSSFYHLWYLLAIFYALIWFYWLLCNVKFRYIPLMVCFLWALEVLEYAYRDFLPMDIKKYFIFFDYLGTISISFTRMLPLLLVGAMIAKGWHKKAGVYRKVLLCFAMMTAEVVGLKLLGGARYSFVIFTLPMAYFLFIFILKLGNMLNLDSKKWADISMLIYCLHPAFIFLFHRLHISQPLIVFILTSIMTTIFCILYYRWKRHYQAAKSVSL